MQTPPKHPRNISLKNGLLVNANGTISWSKGEDALLEQAVAKGLKPKQMVDLFSSPERSVVAIRGRLLRLRNEREEAPRPTKPKPEKRKPTPKPRPLYQFITHEELGYKKGKPLTERPLSPYEPVPLGSGYGYCNG